MDFIDYQCKFILTPAQYAIIQAELLNPLPRYVLIPVPPEVGLIRGAVYRFFDTRDRELWQTDRLEFRILEAGCHLWLDLKVPLGGRQRRKIRVDVSDRFRRADDFSPQMALDILLKDPTLTLEAQNDVHQFLSAREFVDVLRFVKSTDRIHLARQGTQTVCCKVSLDQVDFRPPNVQEEGLVLHKMDLQTEGMPPDLAVLEEVADYYQQRYGLTREEAGGKSTYEIALERLDIWRKTFVSMPE